MTEFRDIAYDVDGPVATITLDRPDRLNAFTVRMQREMNDAFDLVDGDDAVRAVIVTGRGRGFCAGADLGGGGETFDAEAAVPGGAMDKPDPTTSTYPRDFGGGRPVPIYKGTKPGTAPHKQ